MATQQERRERRAAHNQALRADPERFAIVADARHVHPAVEDVIGHGSGYWTVAVSAAAATLARRPDERAA